MNNFKVLFPLVKAGSGSDIYTYNLVSGLRKSSIHADIQYLPKWSGYFPLIMGKMCNFSGYDVIHANTWNGYTYYKDLPLVVTEHLIVHDPLFTKYKTLSQRVYHSYVYQCEKKSIACADVVVNISKYSQTKLEEIFGFSDSVLIYNGIDCDIFKPIFGEKPHIIMKYPILTGKKILFFSGNPTSRKGGDLLPKIMKELGDDYLLLMSSGLRKNKHINSSNIITLGKLSLQELIEIYNYSDIFLFPTRLEGFGLSVAEAMACGKPVVTTNCSSLPELIVDGKGGFLCEIDNIKDYADSIQIIAEDSSLHREMGRYNRERAIKKFSLNRMVQEYINVYKKL